MGAPYPPGPTGASGNGSITSSSWLDLSWARNPACTASWQSRLSAGHGSVVTTQSYSDIVTVAAGNAETRTYITGPFMSQVYITKTYIGPTTGVFVPQVLTNGVDTPCCGDCFIRYPNVRVYYWPVKKNSNTWCLKYHFTSSAESNPDSGHVFGTLAPGESLPVGGFLSANSDTATDQPKLSDVTRSSSLKPWETDAAPIGLPTLKRRYGRFKEKLLVGAKGDGEATQTTEAPAASTITPLAQLPPWSPHILQPRTFQPLNGSENGTIVYAEGPNGMIFTSPSIYVVISTIDARDKCGEVGHVYTSLTMSFSENELLTVDANVGGTSVFNFADLPSPPAAYVSDRTVPNAIIGNSALQSDLAKNYHPRILVPTQSLKSLDPKWASCAIIDVGNGYDPPRPLVPMTGLDPVSTAPPGVEPTAEPAAVPKPPHAQHTISSQGMQGEQGGHGGHALTNGPAAHTSIPWGQILATPSPNPHKPPGPSQGAAQPIDPGNPSNPGDPATPAGPSNPTPPEHAPTIISVTPNPPALDPVPSPVQLAEPGRSPVVVGGMTFMPAQMNPTPAVPVPVQQPQPFTQGGFTFTPAPAPNNAPQPVAQPAPAQPAPGQPAVVPGQPANPASPAQQPKPAQQGQVSPGDPAAPIGPGTQGEQHPQPIPAAPQVITAGGVTLTPVPVAPKPNQQPPNMQPASGQPIVAQPAAPRPIVVGGITAVPEPPAQALSPTKPANQPLAPLILSGLGGAATHPADAPTPVATVGGHPVNVDASNAVVGGETITAGAPPRVIAGTPISLGASAIVVGSQTIVKPPVPVTPAAVAPVAPLTVGGETFTPNPTGFSVAGTFLSQGGAGITIGNTPVSLGSQGLIVGSKTIPPQQIVDGPAQMEPTAFSIQGTTISRGGPGITVSGTPVSLGDSELVVGSSTIPLADIHSAQSAAQPSVFSVGGTALTLGGPAVTISNTRLSLGAAGLVVGSKTVPLPAIETPPPQSGGQIAPAVLSVAGTALTEGASPITVSGTRLSLGASGVVIGSSTIPLPAGASSIFAAGGQHFTAAPEVFFVGNQALTYGAPAITVSGTRLSLGNAGLVIGTSTMPLPTAGPTAVSASIFAVAGHTFMAAPTGFAIAPGMTIYPGGPAATVSGTRISAAASSIVVGSYTYALPSGPSSIFTIGGSTITASASGFAIGSTTLTPGGPDATISGTKISLDMGGELVIGSKTYDLPPQTIFTTDGMTFTANAAGYLVSGTEISSGGPPITIHGTKVSMDGSNMVVGTDTIPLAELSPKSVNASITTGTGTGTGTGTITSGPMPTGSAGVLPGPSSTTTTAGARKMGLQKDVWEITMMIMIALCSMWVLQ